MDRSPKKEAGVSEGTQPKSSRGTAEMTQFIGPFTVNTTQDTVESFAAQIDKYITEKKSHIHGDFPDGFTILYQQKELKRLKKLRKLNDYRDLTLQPLEKEPTGQEEQPQNDEVKKDDDDVGFD